MWRRRQYLIKKGFQFRFAIFITLLLLLTSASISLFIYFGIIGSVIPELSVTSMLEKIEAARRIKDYEIARYGLPQTEAIDIFKEAQLLSNHEKEVVSNILSRINLELLPRLFIFLILICLLALFISHRIAGPIYHFQKILKAAKEGNFSLDTRLRKTDEFKELSRDFDLFFKSLSSQVNKIKELTKTIQTDISCIQSQIEKVSFSNKNILNERIKKMASSIDTLKQTLDKFYTTK
jgi:methyl-accepting chemotaxis protein